jgi:hypothetical protein
MVGQNGQSLIETGVVEDYGRLPKATAESRCVSEDLSLRDRVGPNLGTLCSVDRSRMGHNLDAGLRTCSRGMCVAWGQ